MSKHNRRGFTLAELLVVVAIIGVLVAVSIPIFTSQLDKAKISTNAANIKAAQNDAIYDYLYNDRNQAYRKLVNNEKVGYYNYIVSTGKFNTEQKQASNPVMKNGVYQTILVYITESNGNLNVTTWPYYVSSKTKLDEAIVNNQGTNKF